MLRHQEYLLVPEYATGCLFNLNDAVSFAPQLAVIAGPSTSHVATALSLARAGTHLLVEKPLSASLDDIPMLLQTCHERGVLLLVGYNLRFLPSLQRFRNLLFENVIGKVLSVRCEIGQYLPSWRPDADYRQGVSACRELGGGALLELSHELDYLRWIFGEIDWVKGTLSRQSRLEIDVEDSVHLILGFKHADDGYQLIATLNMDFIRHDTTRLCTAIGEAGSLRWNGITGTIEQFEADAKEWSELFRDEHKYDDTYLVEWEHFLKCINSEDLPLITGEDGLMVLKIIEAIRQASKFGNQVYLEKS